MLVKAILCPCLIAQERHTSTHRTVRAGAAAALLGITRLEAVGHLRYPRILLFPDMFKQPHPCLWLCCVRMLYICLVLGWEGSSRLRVRLPDCRHFRCFFTQVKVPHLQDSSCDEYQQMQWESWIY